MRRAFSGSVVVLAVLLSPAVEAKTIVVGPADGAKPIQAALPGDEVLLLPGTYPHRLVLDNGGAPGKPIVLRAQDLSKRPVLDGTSHPDRSSIEIGASHWVVQGIDFVGGHSGVYARYGAGMRDVVVRDCTFRGGNFALNGAADDYVVEYNRFEGGTKSHSLYVYGGTLVLRHNVFLDSGGQHFHVRARSSRIEHNFFARAGSYLGDLMSCECLCGATSGKPITQTMLLLGNVLVTGPAPSNPSQIVALFHDEPNASKVNCDDSGEVTRMQLTMAWNTVVGLGGAQKLINLRNDTVATDVRLENNAIVSVADVAEPREPSRANWSIAGRNNWLTTGTKAAELEGSTFGGDPMFVSSVDLRPKSGSPLVGKAGVVTVEAPAREIFGAEKDRPRHRARVSAKDLGAFEHDTTGPSLGPYDVPNADAGSDAPLADAASLDAATDGAIDAPRAADASGDAPSDPASGCSCTTSSRANASGCAIAGLLLASIGGRRRRSSS